MDSPGTRKREKRLLKWLSRGDVPAAARQEWGGAEDGDEKSWIWD